MQLENKQGGLPPPPPPISSLNLGEPSISEHSYTLHHEKKHLRLLNGEQEFTTQEQEVESKLKKEKEAAELNSLESESTGDKIQRNLESCGKCGKCGHWIEKDEMKTHLTFHAAQVLDNLLLGDKHSSSSRKELFVRNKVTHILNAAAELPNPFEGEGVTYLQLNLYDQIGEDVIAEALRGSQFIKGHLEEGGVVFVHCAVGQSRSVSCIIMYLMRFRGMNYEESLSLIRKSRPIARPNLTYRQSLQEYYQKELKK